MSAPVPEWAVVGNYRKRPVPHGEFLDLLSAAANEAISAEDAPILLYDVNVKSSTNPGQGNNSSSGSSPAAAAALRVPRYIAKKIDIPPSPAATSGASAVSSSSISAADEPLKMISLAPPFPLQGAVDAKEVLNVDCSQHSPQPVGNNRRNQQVSSRLMLSTTIPTPSQLSFILPFVLFLADIAVLVVGLTTQKTRKEFIAACCVLVLVPDVATLVFVVKKGSVCTTVALHLLLWANVLLLFLQPYTSPLFFVHFILIVLMTLFVLRLRASSRTTFCHLT